VSSLCVNLFLCLKIVLSNFGMPLTFLEQSDPLEATSRLGCLKKMVTKPNPCLNAVAEILALPKLDEPSVKRLLHTLDAKAVAKAAAKAAATTAPKATAKPWEETSDDEPAADNDGISGEEDEDTAAAAAAAPTTTPDLPDHLWIKIIDPDGNCLFAAIADQLSDQLSLDIGNGHSEVRTIVCDYISDHKDHFSKFIVTGESFEGYIRRMKKNGQWGGNPELVAAARNYG
jgi:hypothetical protein